MSETLLRLTGRLNGPAFPGAGSVGNTIRGFDYVPGSTLRGALAAAWVEQTGRVPQEGLEAREDFVRIFEGGRLFGDLRARGSQAIPLSLWVHKYSNAPCPEAIDAASASELPHACPSCGGPLTQAKPGMVWQSARHKRISSTRVTLTDDDVAADGQLYTREGIAGGTEMSALLVGDGENFAGIQRLWVGGRKTVAGQLRDVDIAALDSEALAALRPEVRQSGDSWEVILYLAGQAIFVDTCGRPMDRPSDAELTSVLGVEAQVTRAWSRLESMGGWHAISGLPKPVEWVTSAGSVFVVRVSEPVSDTALDRLMRRGLGLRRAEGFGMVFRSPAQVLRDQARASVEAAERDERADRAIQVSWTRLEAPLNVFKSWNSEIRLAVVKDCEERALGGVGDGLIERIAARTGPPVEYRLAAETLLREGPVVGWRDIADALRGNS